MRSGLGEEEARFISEFILLENYPDAEIIDSIIQEGLEVDKEGMLVFTTSLTISARIPFSTESIIIDLKIYNK